eukprot:gene1516-1852_t
MTTCGAVFALLAAGCLLFVPSAVLATTGGSSGTAGSPSSGSFKGCSKAKTMYSSLTDAVKAASAIPKLTTLLAVINAADVAGALTP